MNFFHPLGTTVSSQKWCKLRGNLLFYFKSNDQFSEPAGVIVLEKYRVTVANETDSLEGFPFYIGKNIASFDLEPFKSKLLSQSSRMD